MMHSNYLINEAKAWIKRKDGGGEIVRIVSDPGNNEPILSYQLFTAFDKEPEYLGRILFDANGYWIYDGQVLTVSEQEQAAAFIIKYLGNISYAK